MSSKIFLWIEDREGKASYVFWETLMANLCPNVIVESKKNNSELIKAVKDLKDKDNKYIIVLDNSFDNLQVYRERKRLSKYAEIKSNVILMDIICFEYILLEFDRLIDWIYAPNDEFLVKRSRAISAREKLVNAIRTGEFDYKQIQEIVAYDNSIDNHNIEQLSAKLLYDLTRNTGFEVSKGKIGACWIKSCCEWLEREESDICGLDDNRLLIKDKLLSICEGTVLNKELKRVGLEMVL